MWHLWGIGQMRIGFGWGNMRERDHSGRPRCRWENNIKMYLQEIRLMVCSGLNWPQILRSCGIL